MPADEAPEGAVDIGAMFTKINGYVSRLDDVVEKMAAEPTAIKVMLKNWMAPVLKLLVEALDVSLQVGVVAQQVARDAHEASTMAYEEAEAQAQTNIPIGKLRQIVGQLERELLGRLDPSDPAARLLIQASSILESFFGPEDEDGDRQAAIEADDGLTTLAIPGELTERVHTVGEITADPAPDQGASSASSAALTKNA